MLANPAWNASILLECVGRTGRRPPHSSHLSWTRVGPFCQSSLNGPVLSPPCFHPARGGGLVLSRVPWEGLGAGARGGGSDGARTRSLPPCGVRAKRGARAPAPNPRPPSPPLVAPGGGGAVWEGRAGTRWVGQVGGVSPGVPRTAEGPPPWAHAAHPAFPTGGHYVWLTCHVVHACMPHPPAWSVGARPKVGEP